MTLTLDGIYKTRTGKHGEQLIQVPREAATHYKRLYDAKTKEIRFVAVE